METVEVTLTVDELRYLVACGFALIQNVPPTAVATYCGFTDQQIYAFSGKMREVLDLHGYDM